MAPPPRIMAPIDPGDPSSSSSPPRIMAPDGAVGVASESRGAVASENRLGAENSDVPVTSKSLLRRFCMLPSCVREGLRPGGPVDVSGCVGSAAVGAPVGPTGVGSAAMDDVGAVARAAGPERLPRPVADLSVEEELGAEARAAGLRAGSGETAGPPGSSSLTRGEVLVRLLEPGGPPPPVRPPVRFREDVDNAIDELFPELAREPRLEFVRGQCGTVARKGFFFGAKGAVVPAPCSEGWKSSSPRTAIVVGRLTKEPTG